MEDKQTNHSSTTYRMFQDFGLGIKMNVKDSKGHVVFERKRTSVTRSATLRDLQLGQTWKLRRNLPDIYSFDVKRDDKTKGHVESSWMLSGHLFGTCNFGVEGQHYFCRLRRGACYAGSADSDEQVMNFHSVRLRTIEFTISPQIPRKQHGLFVLIAIEMGSRRPA